MSWQTYEKAAEKGPLQMTVVWGCGGLACLFILTVLFGGCAYIGGWFSEAGQVAQEQLGPRALLRKYEWFKDAAAQLDARAASIKVYEDRFADLKKQYGDAPRAKWAREDRDQSNLWQSEMAGIKSSYNGLAAEYNAQMAKMNWRFCNAGDLPQGVDRVLPREYRVYESK